MRSELLTFLQTSQQTYTLTEVALDEGEIDKAIELLKAARVSNQSHGRTYNYDSRYYTIAIKVANAAAEPYPHAAIGIYQPYIEHLVSQRGRSNYETACSYLAKVRTLYEKLGESEEWTNYIALLRKQNSRLVAFKQELAAAGL